ncbi:transcriptional repressor [Diaporthe australafricana]|uniref:Transcriptional repressor n=1 Tax=Diaporthe australafricana TaxID=127596 RepID=A0ABR3XRV4_9PEZI
MSPTHRNASGRLISILQDSNELDYESNSSHKADLHSQGPPFSSLLLSHSMPGLAHSSYASAPHRENVHSHPSTPDLMRSHSYDSQTSNDPASPVTPAGTYPEQQSSRQWPQKTAGMTGSDTFFPTSKAQAPSSSAYRGEPRPVLPPISSFTSLPSPRTATSPSAAYPYENMLRHHSSSSLEEHHYRRSLDTHEDYPASVLEAGPETTVQRNAESCNDFSHQVPSPSSLDQDHSMDLDEEDEPVESTSPGKKGSKGKTCTSPKRYPCKFRETYSCYKTFTTSGHASRHAKIHTAEKTVPCSWPGCNRRFTRSDNMKQHLETHKKDKPRASARQTRRPSLAANRRQSSSSRSSVSGFSLPRDTPPLMSPSIASALLSPSLISESWVRPVASRTPSSGLDALAMVAADESRAEQEATCYQFHQRPQQH